MRGDLGRKAPQPTRTCAVEARRARKGGVRVQRVIIAAQSVQQRLLARDFPNSPLAGVARIATDGQLAVHDTKMRSGTAGLYYPAHSDCYHNVLLVLEGVRRVRLLDQPAVWRGAAGSFSDLLRLTELEEAAVSRIRAALSSNARARS